MILRLWEEHRYSQSAMLGFQAPPLASAHQWGKANLESSLDLTAWGALKAAWNRNPKKVGLSNPITPQTTHISPTKQHHKETRNITILIQHCSPATTKKPLVPRRSLLRSAKSWRVRALPWAGLPTGRATAKLLGLRRLDVWMWSVQEGDFSSGCFQMAINSEGSLVVDAGAKEYERLSQRLWNSTFPSISRPKHQDWTRPKPLSKRYKRYSQSLPKSATKKAWAPSYSATLEHETGEPSGWMFFFKLLGGFKPFQKHVPSNGNNHSQKEVEYKEQTKTPTRLP